MGWKWENGVLPFSKPGDQQTVFSPQKASLRSRFRRIEPFSKTFFGKPSVFLKTQRLTKD